MKNPQASPRILIALLTLLSQSPVSADIRLFTDMESGIQELVERQMAGNVRFPTKLPTTLLVQNGPWIPGPRRSNDELEVKARLIYLGSGWATMVAAGALEPKLGLLVTKAEHKIEYARSPMSYAEGLPYNAKVSSVLHGSLLGLLSVSVAGGADALAGGGTKGFVAGTVASTAFTSALGFMSGMGYPREIYAGWWQRPAFRYGIFGAVSSAVMLGIPRIVAELAY